MLFRIQTKGVLKMRIVVTGLLAIVISSSAFADENETASPAESWQGAYAGISITNENRDYSQYTNDRFGGLDGVSGGGQVGYRIPLDNRLVAGLELAAYTGDINASEREISCRREDCEWDIEREERRTQNLGADLLAEAGVTVGENYLVSVVGGVSWAQFERSFEYQYSNGPEPDFTGRSSSTTNMVGWSYGFRVSRQFRENWSVEAQCLNREFTGEQWNSDWSGQTFADEESGGGRSCMVRLNFRG